MSLDPISAVSDFLTATVNKIFPDATQKAQAMASLAELKESDEFKAQALQLQINLADAQSKSKFQSWWRPALAWNCVITFIYHFSVYPMASFYFPIKDVDAQSFTMLFGLLMTLIGARSLEKTKGVDTP